MRKQDWAQAGFFVAVVGALASFRQRRLIRGLVLAGAAVGLDQAGRNWSRQDPTPLPWSMRFWLLIPQPGSVLQRVLAPQVGERILEIGPGLGQNAVKVAGAVGEDGTLEVFDVQPEMLDATIQRAERNGVQNIVASVGDASDPLPYEDASLDAAYLMGVLGEIRDRDRALAELRRVLKPDGRLVVGEMFMDPDFIPPTTLQSLAEDAGFRIDERFGPALAYEARLVPA